MNLIETESSCEEDARLLRSFPAECVDLVYLDAAFFSSWVHEGLWAERLARVDYTAERSQDGAGIYLDWIAGPLEDLSRILKPSGALFLVCDQSVGRYVRLLLDEIFSQPDAHNRTAWSKADCGPAHHHVFFRRKSAETESHGDLYTVIHGEGRGDWSLVGFSFLQGRLRPQVFGRRAARERGSRQIDAAVQIPAKMVPKFGANPKLREAVE